jgi:hypothetical protein
MDLRAVTLTDKVVHWLATFPNLRSIGLRRCKGVGPKLALLVRRCRALRVLNLSRCRLVDVHLMKLADAAERRLEDLDLSWNPALTDEGVDYLAERCNHLVAIRLTGLSRLNDAALVGSVGAGGLLPVHAPRLVRLDVAHCGGLTDGVTDVLWSRVRDAMNDPSTALEAAKDPEGHARRTAPRLQELDISFLPRLTDEGLRSLVDLTEVGTWMVGDLELGRKRAEPLDRVHIIRICGCPKVTGSSDGVELAHVCTSVEASSLTTLVPSLLAGERGRPVVLVVRLSEPDHDGRV